jgi:hypothetical protein
MCAGSAPSIRWPLALPSIPSALFYKHLRLLSALLFAATIEVFQPERTTFALESVSRLPGITAADTRYSPHRPRMESSGRTIVRSAGAGCRRGIGGKCARQHWFFEPLRGRTAVVATTGRAFSSGFSGLGGIPKTAASLFAKRNYSKDKDLRKNREENLKTRSDTSRLSPPPEPQPL